MRLKKKKSETFSVLKIVHKRINMHIQMHFDVMLPNQESSELISHRLSQHQNTYPKDKNCVKINILELICILNKIIK